MRALRSTITTNLLLIAIIIVLCGIARLLYFERIELNDIESNMPTVPQPCGHDDINPCHVYIVPH